MPAVTCPSCAAFLTASEGVSAVICPMCKGVAMIHAPQPPTELYRPTATPIRFFCPTCKTGLECEREKAGTKMACTNCGQRLAVPVPPPPPPKPVAHTVLGSLANLQPPPPAAAPPIPVASLATPAQPANATQPSPDESIPPSAAAAYSLGVAAAILSTVAFVACHPLSWLALPVSAGGTFAAYACRGRHRTSVITLNVIVLAVSFVVFVLSLAMMASLHRY